MDDIGNSANIAMALGTDCYNNTASSNSILYRKGGRPPTSGRSEQCPGAGRASTGTIKVGELIEQTLKAKGHTRRPRAARARLLAGWRHGCV
jgi:hypothetical protein